MGKPNILFVSYGHEVTKLASTIQNHRLIGALEKFYDVTILARSKKRRSDSSLFVWSPNLFIIDRVLYKVFPFILSVFCIDRLFWSWKAFYKIRNSISKYDYIIMPYEPYTIRSLQKRIKKYYDVKIITLLYDPYLDNIFFPQSSVAKLLRMKVEKKIVEMSDCVVVNSPRMYRTFLKRYPEGNIRNLPFCGKEEITRGNGVKNEKLKIVHAGNIFGERRIDELNNTITLLKQKIGDAGRILSVELYGSVCEGYDKVQEAHNDDVIIYKGSVSQDQMGAILASADALLLIDPMNEMNYSYPSKLCEYFQYKKIIIGFSGKGTPSYEALKESNNIVYSKGEEERMADGIVDLIKTGAENNTPIEYSEQFYPQNVAKELKSIIDNM